MNRKAILVVVSVASACGGNGGSTENILRTFKGSGTASLVKLDGGAEVEPALQAFLLTEVTLAPNADGGITSNWDAHSGYVRPDLTAACLLSFSESLQFESAPNKCVLEWIENSTCGVVAMVESAVAVADNEGLAMSVHASAALTGCPDGTVTTDSLDILFTGK